MTKLTQKIITNWKRKMTDWRSMKNNNITSWRLKYNRSRINASELVILLNIQSVGDLVIEIRFNKPALCDVKLKV